MGNCSGIFRKTISAMIVTIIVSTVPAIAAIDISNSLDLLYDDGNGNTMPYRLFIPTPFDSTKDYPVVLFMHGAGERGTDNYLQVSVHIGGLVDTTRSGDNAAYLIAPQVPTGSQWVNVPWSEGSYDNSTAPAESLSMRLGIEILEHVIATRKVDTSRVYVTGLSMGGFGTVRLQKL